MEITNEIKAKVFSGYLPYFIDSHMRLGMLKIIETLLVENPKYHNRLILKPLSAITDEDAAKVIKIFGCLNSLNHGTITEFSPVSKMKKAINLVTIFPAHVHQYLQSKGYDISQYLLDGKTLHETGLAVYE